jgi:hypothetical protein
MPNRGSLPTKKVTEVLKCGDLGAIPKTMGLRLEKHVVEFITKQQLLQVSSNVSI